MNYGVREADHPSPQQRLLEQSQAHGKSRVALTLFACKLVRIPTRLSRTAPLSICAARARIPEHPSHNID